MHTKFALEKDIESVKDLWRYSFSDTEEFIKYYFEKRYSKDNNLLSFDEDNLTGSLMLNPYKLIVGDEIKNTSYVVGVSVEPEYRGSGHSTLLMKNALKALYQKGEDISILMPIDTKIYTRYGYINTFFRYEYETQLSNIVSTKSSLKIKRIKLQNSEIQKEIDDLIKIYYSSTQNIYSKIFRDQEYYKNKLQELELDGGTVFGIYQDKEILGYLMLIPSGTVLEMLFKGKDAFDGLMNLIKSHSTQFSKVNITTPNPEIFNRFINYDNKYISYKKPFMMSRIINAQNVLEEIKSKSSLKENIAIQVVDNIIEENNILWQSGDEPDIKIKMQIEDLTGLYLKSLTIEDLYNAQKILLDELDLKYFIDFFGNQRHSNYINDYI